MGDQVGGDLDAGTGAGSATLPSSTGNPTSAIAVRSGDR
jgi:hypothetical protein